MTRLSIVRKKQTRVNHCPVIWTDQLPPFKGNPHQSRVVQFSAYFKKLMTDNGSSTLMLPSVLQLAQFFNCCELDILDTLYELKQQGYQYDMPDFNGLITLRDTLGHSPSAKISKPFWRRVSAAVF